MSYPHYGPCSPLQDLPREIVEFLVAVAQEVDRAQRKFPSSDGSICATGEEFGELCKAYMDEGPDEVRAEAIQLAAMAVRVALEGDPTLDAIRIKRGNLPYVKEKKKDE